jgi:hypothetical protein
MTRETVDVETPARLATVVIDILNSLETKNTHRRHLKTDYARQKQKHQT